MRLSSTVTKNILPPMKPTDVVKHFGGIIPAAKAIGVSRQAVYIWLQRKHIPMQRAYQIQVITGGALKAHP